MDTEIRVHVSVGGVRGAGTGRHSTGEALGLALEAQGGVLSVSLEAALVKAS